MKSFVRAAYLRTVRMPGGEKAAREPWRMAMAHTIDAEVDIVQEIEKRIGRQEVRTVMQMLKKHVNSPLTSSAGRLFDAVAGLLALRDRASFEGQAAMELEWLASGVETRREYPFSLQAVASGVGSARWEIDTRPMVRSIVEDVQRAVPVAMIARKFHNTVSAMIVETCSRLRADTGIDKIVMSGGVFMNALLQRETQLRLENLNFLPLIHNLLPPNDGSVSVGQLSIAASLVGVSDVPGNSREGR
jgi:hydrogenase maturation protein HypF